MPTNAAGDRVLFPREFVERAVRDAPYSFVLYDRDGKPSRRPRRRPRPLRARLERPARARPPHRRDPPGRHDRLRRVRPPGRRPSAHRLPRDGLLDQQGHRGTGFRRVAPLPGPDQLEEAGRVGRLHRARRAADGRDDGAVPSRPGGPHRPPDVDLHDHRDRQFPLQRGLLPEPDRLRRGGHPGRDRARDADGPDRPGHAGRRDGLPHGRRPGRDHDGPGDPARAPRSCSAEPRRRST